MVKGTVRQEGKQMERKERKETARERGTSIEIKRTVRKWRLEEMIYCTVSS